MAGDGHGKAMPYSVLLDIAAAAWINMVVLASFVQGEKVTTHVLLFSLIYSEIL